MADLPGIGNYDFNTSILDAVRQGKVSSDSGLVAPVSASQQTFRQVSADVIKKQLDLDYSNNPSLGNAYSQYRKPWIMTTFEALDSLAPVSASGSSSQVSQEVEIEETEVINGKRVKTKKKTIVQKDINQLTGDDKDAKRIFLAVNPSSITWSIPQRGVEAKNKSGTVHHYWYDQVRKTYFDDPKITLNFQTGNIMPLPEFSDPDAAGSSDPTGPMTRKISPSLFNFYQFLSLVDQQKITKNGNANLIHILYRSNIFPAMVMTGLFDPQLVVQFTDDSQSPWKISGWTATFTIFSTTPEIKNYANLVQMFRAEFGREAVVE